MDTVNGPFVIFDWSQYRGFSGYCPGQDDVSMTLELYGVWESPDWDQLSAGEGRALDFGSHIGWYAIRLAELGYKVFAVDADPTNCQLLLMNARRRDLRIELVTAWAADLPKLSFTDVVFIKSDVEGAEADVMTACQTIIRDQHPQMLLEISPEFADYYPSLYRYLEALGYRPSVPMPQTQENVWFR